MTKNLTTLKRPQIRRILLRRRGACAQLARDLKLPLATLSKWLSGRFDSARISEAAHTAAKRILTEEQQQRSDAA